MNKEEIENNYIEMLIRDLEEHSLEYWDSTQSEMAEALRKLQQENKQLKDKYNQLLDDEELLQMKIDKAIEYIELEQYKGTLWSVNSTDNLLEILKNY